MSGGGSRAGYGILGTMTKELKRAVQEVQTLPAKDQDAIGRQVRYHVEKLRVLRGAVDAGIRALDDGHGEEVEIEDLIRVARHRHEKRR